MRERMAGLFNGFWLALMILFYLALFVLVIGGCVLVIRKLRGTNRRL